MYTKISIMFKKDAARTPFWPAYIFPTTHALDIFYCIVEHTGNEDLAAEVAGWADLAGISEEYDCDELTAVILDN